MAVIQEAWIGGRSTRQVDDLVQALGMTGISKSQVSALCQDIDARVESFLTRPIEGEWPCLWLDAPYLKVRKGGRVVSVAAIIACGVTQDGRREILGLGLGDSEAQVFSASWPRCRVHFLRNLLACVPKASQSLIGTLVQQVYVQPDAKSAQQAWRQVADQLRPRLPKAAELMNGAEAGVLAHLHFPAAHRVKIHSTNTLEWLNKEVKRRANGVGLFPNEASIRRLIGAVLMEQNEEWQLQHRYLPQHTMVENLAGTADLASLPA